MKNKPMVLNEFVVAVAAVVVVVEEVQLVDLILELFYLLI